MTRSWLRTASFLFLAAASPRTGHAAILTVAPDGSGDYATIAAAIAAAQSGDSIELLDGIFRGAGNRDLDYLGKAITVRSESGNPEACVIDCEGGSRGVSFQRAEGPSSILEGITITRGFSHGSNVEGWGGAILCLSSPDIRHCRFVDNIASETGGAIAVYGGMPRIANCRFEGNSTGICGQCDGGGAMAVMWGASATIDGCTFFEDYASGGEVICGGAAAIHIANSEFTGGIFSAILAFDSSSLEADGCTMAWIASDEETGLVTLRANSRATLRSSLLAFGESAVRCDATSQATLACCDVFGISEGNYVGCLAGQESTAGNISADPLFCSEYGDAHVCTDSPCLPPNNACGVRIGSGDAGCGVCAGPTPVVPLTWGRMKLKFAR